MHVHLRGEPRNSFEGVTFPRTSLSMISLELSSFALVVLWLESWCSVVHFLGPCSPPRPSGRTDREKKQKGFRYPLGTAAPPVQKGNFLPRGFRCLLVPLLLLLLSQGCLGLRQARKNRAKRKNREFPPLALSIHCFLPGSLTRGLLLESSVSSPENHLCVSGFHAFRLGHVEGEMAKSGHFGSTLDPGCLLQCFCYYLLSRVLK